MTKFSKSFNRRQFIKGVGLTGVTAALEAYPVAGNTISKNSANVKKAKNLIFLVVDGMGRGTFSLGEHWSLQNRGKSLNLTQLYQHPGIRQALQDTASATSPVTDSAAAASAWGCGHRVNNGSINMDARGVSLTPLYHYAKAAGKLTGLVTTCRVTHATPAGFVANVIDRDLEDAIARQYLEREVDVLLGGGRQHFQRPAVTGMPRSAPIDLIPEFMSNGYTCIRSLSEMNQNETTTRLLGLFSDSHMPYAIDREYNATFSEMPDLPMLFKTALARLGSFSAGFLLLVEAGRVDHAAHVNDPAAILHELLEFDRCIPIALEYLKKDPETLLIITTDHGSGGCQLNGLGENYEDSKAALKHVNQATASFDALETEFRASGRFDRGRFVEVTGLVPTNAQTKAIQVALEDETIEYLSSAMTRIMAEAIMEKTSVGWTSNEHTAEQVDLLALGPGSDQLAPFIRNDELFDVVKQALGV